MQPSLESDPIAELARLIGQADPHGRDAPAENRFHEQTAPDGHDGPPVLPLALVALTEFEHAHERDELYRDGGPCDFEEQSCPPSEGYQYEVPRTPLRNLSFVMAICGLALLGTAGAIGYRDIFGGSVTPSNEPSEIKPASGEPQAKKGDNGSQIGAATGSIDEMVSRQEQSFTVEPPKLTQRAISTIPIETSRGSPPPAGAPATASLPTAGRGVSPIQAMPRVAVTADPSGARSTVATSSPRAGQSSAADVTVASDPEHSAAVPNAANANSTAVITPAALANAYAVQVTSERSESRAQASFRALQEKYPSQLSGREPIIRRADLGVAGIYYRALVGPFASAEKAAKLCSGLKAAGGDCIIQKI